MLIGSGFNAFTVALAVAKRAGTGAGMITRAIRGTCTLWAAFAIALVPLLSHAPALANSVLASSQPGVDELVQFVCTTDGTGYTEETSIAGGPGDSDGEPLVVRAVSTTAGIASEYAYIQHVVGEPTVDWYMLAQALVGDADTGPIDLLVIWEVAGMPSDEPSDIEQAFGEMYDFPSGTVRTFSFSIAEFFGRGPEGSARCTPMD